MKIRRLLALTLILLMMTAPESYQVHVWDNDESTDAQMPFEIRVEWGN